MPHDEDEVEEVESSDASASDASASTSEASSSDASDEKPKKKSKHKSKKVKKEKKKSKKSKSKPEKKEKSKKKKGKKDKKEKKEKRKKSSGAQAKSWKTPFKPGSNLDELSKPMMTKSGVKSKDFEKSAKKLKANSKWAIRIFRKGVRRQWNWKFSDKDGKYRISSVKLGR